MALKGVVRPGYIQIRVLDTDAAVRHYVDRVGLHEVSREPDGRVYLRAWDEFDRHSVVLRRADMPGMDYVGFKVASDADLDSFRRRIEGRNDSVGGLGGFGQRKIEHLGEEFDDPGDIGAVQIAVIKASHSHSVRLVAPYLGVLGHRPVVGQRHFRKQFDAVAGWHDKAQTPPETLLLARGDLLDFCAEFLSSAAPTRRTTLPLSGVRSQASFTMPRSGWIRGTRSGRLPT